MVDELMPERNSFYEDAKQKNFISSARAGDDGVDVFCYGARRMGRRIGG